MAIGDAVAVFMGPGTTNRQPSAGVEERITANVSNGSTDPMTVYEGVNFPSIVDGSVTGGGATDLVRQMKVIITNSIYLRKTGTTNLHYIGGVQTNA